MNLHKLADFFCGRMELTELASDLDAEVEAFKRSAAKTGSSSPVYGDKDDFEFIVHSEDVKKLCEGYLSGSLSEWHIYYLSTLLELSESFEFADDDVEKAIFLMSDPVVNYPLTDKLVGLICSWLDGAREDDLESYLQKNGVRP